MLLPDARAGALRIRLDIVVVLAFVGWSGGPSYALALLLAIAVHELGHAVAARVERGRFEWVLQLTGGQVYVRDMKSRRGKLLVLLAGPVASGGLGILGGIASLPDISSAALLWTAYQLAFFPPLDGGLLLLSIFDTKVERAMTLWRVAWVLGVIEAIAAVLIWPALLLPVFGLVFVAVALDRGHAGYVRHVDAYRAFEKGDYARVLALSLDVSKYVQDQERVALLELAVQAAMESKAHDKLVRAAEQLPPGHPAAVQAAEHLLRLDKGEGVRLAERAFDAADAEKVKNLDPARWSDLALAFAGYEARGMRLDSAAGLLERALTWGWRDAHSIDLTPGLERLKAHPRWSAIVSKLG